MTWDLKLAEAREPGLEQALHTLLAGLRRDFVGFIARNYPRWIAQPDSDRPALSCDVVEEMVLPVLKEHGRVLFIVVDCLRLDQWEALLPLVTPLFDVETSHYFSILPSATPYSRNALFAGLLPRDIASQYPAWWTEREDESLNAHEPDLLARQLERITGRPVPCRYEKLFGAGDGDDVRRRLPAHLAQDGVTAMVFNFIDQLTHGRSENAILYEVAKDAQALRSLTRAWFERSSLKTALIEAERRRVRVVLTSDHGSIHCLSPATVFAKRDATNNLRFKFGEDLRAEVPESAITVENPESYGLPRRGLGVRCLFATEDRFFVYPTKLREYQARYRGSFLHGGVSPGGDDPPGGPAPAAGRALAWVATASCCASCGRTSRSSSAGSRSPRSPRCSTASRSRWSFRSCAPSSGSPPCCPPSARTRSNACSTGRWGRCSPGGNTQAALRNVILVILSAMAIKNLILYVSRVMVAVVQERVVRDMRMRLYAHLQGMGLDYFQRTKGGQLLTRMLADAEAAKPILGSEALAFVQAVGTLVVYLAMLIAISWQLTLLSLVLAPFLILGLQAPGAAAAARVRGRP